MLLFISSLSAASCHLHLCEGVYSGFSGARLGVLLFPAEAEHHLWGLSSWQQGPRPGDPADHHGEGLCNVCERGADSEIRHHQQDQPSWRWVLRKVHGNNIPAGSFHWDTENCPSNHHRTTVWDNNSAIHGQCSSEKEKNYNELFPESKLFFKEQKLKQDETINPKHIDEEQTWNKTPLDGERIK